MSLPEGIQFYSFAEVAEDDPRDHRMTIYLFPLPQEVLQELSDHMKDAAFNWLRERGFGDGTEMDLKAIGGVQ